MEIEQLGPYRLIRRVGRGGMGTVYEGVNLENGDSAAVKVLAPSLASEEGFRERFEAEIETLRKLNHTNIVRLFGFGDQDGALFYVMELVDGTSLEEEIRRGRRFTWREVTQIGIAMCRALRHAHDRGVIHRDIKPANLLLSREGIVKLSDFGIARLFGSTRLTSAGSVLGTAEYMAPEQAEGRAVGPRSDLYSLGGVLYSLLARRPPFRAKSLPEMLHMQRYAMPDPVTRYAKDVPQELEDIIMQLLEKDPAKRVPNATILARRLEAMLRGLSVAESETIADDEDTQHGFDLAVPPTSVRSPEELGPTRADDGSASDATTAPSIDSDADALSLAGATADLTPPAGNPVPAGPDAHAETAAPPVELPSSTENMALPLPAEGPMTLGGGATRVGSGTFVTVPETEYDEHEERLPPVHSVLISPHTWALVIALVAVGLSLYYFLQPPSADALYERVMARARDGSINSLLQAEGDIREFQLRFPRDTRCARLSEFMEDLDLARLERRFNRRANGVETLNELLPIEAAYLEAIQTLRIDPDEGTAMLQALIVLYGTNADRTGPTGQCLELARRKLAHLEKQLAAQGPRHAELVQKRLEYADELVASDPRRAREMWQAVVTLYTGKPWAKAQVATAEERLAQTAAIPLPPPAPEANTPASPPGPSSAESQTDVPEQNTAEPDASDRNE